MKQLNDNWITEGSIDFEYKKYILLDFLQQTDKMFREVKLYPALSELMRHYSSLEQLKEQKNNASMSFPKRIVGFDPETSRLRQERLESDPGKLNEVMEIIEFALPVFKSKIQDGQDLYNFIEGQIKMESIGVEPLNSGEGYLLLHDAKGQDVLIYRYDFQLSKIPTQGTELCEPKSLGVKRKH